MPTGCSYCGYQEVADVPAEADQFVWWYQVPLHYDAETIVAEIASYKQMLGMVIRHIEGRSILLTTMAVQYVARCTMHDEAMVDAAIADYNAYLYALASERTNVKVIDIQRFYRQYSESELIRLEVLHDESDGTESTTDCCLQSMVGKRTKCYCPQAKEMSCAGFG